MRHWLETASIQRRNALLAVAAILVGYPLSRVAFNRAVDNLPLADLVALTIVCLIGLLLWTEGSGSGAGSSWLDDSDTGDGRD